MTPIARLRRLGAMALLLTSACYHATVETGAAPSDQVVERCCEAAFLGGLVPPKTVRSVAACPAGVAKVETSRSFSNLVFTALTAGLYSPMSVRITCAAADSAAPAAALGPLLPEPDFAPAWFVMPSPAPAPGAQAQAGRLGGPSIQSADSSVTRSP